MVQPLPYVVVGGALVRPRQQVVTLSLNQQTAVVYIIQKWGGERGGFLAYDRGLLIVSNTSSQVLHNVGLCLIQTGTIKKIPRLDRKTQKENAK
jgi:hypothetical protein